MAPSERDRAARLLLPDGAALVVAGSSAGERLAPTRATPSGYWFQPEHVRDRPTAGRRLLAAAEAGADVLLAPAYRTHRAALAAVGESRRAAEWTRAAVEVARAAAERAAERADARAGEPDGESEADPEADREADREAARGTHPGARLRPRGSDRGARSATRGSEPVAEDGAASRSDPGADGGAASRSDPGADGGAAGRPRRPLVVPALVAGPVGPLTSGSDRTPDPGGTADADRERVSHLVDAGVDLLLIEGMRSIAEARSALQAAGGSGLPVWLGLGIAPSGRHLPGGDALEEAWQELAPFGAAAWLVSPPSAADARTVLDRVASIAGVPVGLWLDGAETGAAIRSLAGSSGGPAGAPPEGGSATLAGHALGWLESGARVLGLASEADPAAIAELRAAVDARATVAAERNGLREAGWRAAVADAAARTTGGRAVWLTPATSGGGPEPDVWAPPGFDWLRVPLEDAAALPESTFRLVIGDRLGDGSRTDPTRLLERLVTACDPGGYVLMRSAEPLGPIPVNIAVQRVEPLGEAWIVLARRT